MNSDELGLLKELTKTRGYKLYEEILQDKFDNEYKKLRRIQDIHNLDLTNGFLAGIEYALNAIEFVERPQDE